MKKIIQSLIIFGLSLDIKVTQTFALESVTNPAINSLGNNPNKAKSGQLLLEQFVRYWGNAVAVGGLLTIMYFLWGAFEWLMSEGDSGKLQKARNKMMHAAIGLLILVSAFIIIGFVSRLLFGDNFDILNLNFIFANKQTN